MTVGSQRPRWQWTATLLGLVAWAVGAVAVDAAGLGPTWSLAFGFAVSVVVLAVGTLWLVPRRPVHVVPDTT